MIHFRWAVFVLGLALPAGCAASPIPDKLRLDPARSAADYSRSRGHASCCEARRTRASRLGPAYPKDNGEDYSVRRTSSQAPQAAGLTAAVTHDATPAGFVGQLRKVRDKLFIEVTAYEAGNATKRWEGVDAVEEGQRGRTLELGDGRFRGDLSVGIGAEAGIASLSDLTGGTLTVLDLNPIRDVSAQFDFLVRIGELNSHLGFDAFIIRVRAVYLGAFRGGNDEASAATEYTLSMGLSW